MTSGRSRRSCSLLPWATDRHSSGEVVDVYPATIGPLWREREKVTLADGIGVHRGDRLGARAMAIDPLWREGYDRLGARARAVLWREREGDMYTIC